MALAYLLDENQRGLVWQAVIRHNSRGLDPLDVVRVGDPPDLPLGAKDPEILIWAEREHRILVTRDKRTMPGHLANHLRAGRRSPGIFMFSRAMRLAEVLDFLVLAAHASEPGEWQDWIKYLP
jgi:hypothetical protein